MASLYVNEQLPTTSEAAIREFNEKYLMALSAAAPSDWASRFVMSVAAPRVTFPMSFMSTKFVETKEQSGRFKGMDEKSFDLKVIEFSAGYEAKALDLQTNVFAYRNWSAVPGRFVVAEQRHIASQLAALLELGTSTTSPFDDVNFFSASHKANPSFGTATWSNYQVGPLAPTLPNIQAEMTLMRGVKDENGDKLGVNPTEIWLPTEKFQTVSDLLNQAFLASGESNYLAGQIKPVHVPELTDVNDWFLVDPAMMSQGFDPMLAASYRPSDTLGLQIWDESSDFYKDTLKLKIKANIWTGFKLVFPHAIRLVKGA
jgi:hypothetical protein